MQRTLTAPFLDGLKPSGRKVEIFDKLVPGLAVRVGASAGKRSKGIAWRLYYRRHGRLRRLTIGHYPTMGIAAARKLATKERSQIFDGADPVAVRQKARAAWADTVGELLTLYAAEVGKRRRSWPEKHRIHESEIRPAWGDRLVKDITRRDVRALIQAKAATAPVMANRLLAEVSALFNYALSQEWIEHSPALRITKPTTEVSRDRVLTADELRELWPALHQTSAQTPDGTKVPRLNETLNDHLLLVLLTAQRPGEVARMKWQDVDLAAGWWTIPAADAKNQEAHRVPLVAPAVRILKRRRLAAEAAVRYVLSHGLMTSVADRAKKAASELSRGLTFAFTRHDLRRTAASGMAEAGIRREHIAQVLNHRSVTKAQVTAVYDRYSYDLEKRQALEAWERRLATILAAKPTSGHVKAAAAAAGR